MIRSRSETRRVGWVQAITAVLLIFSLHGCVTTTEGGFTEKASPEKAVQQRVALARQYIGEGNWESANRNLELAHDIDPRRADVHEAYGLMYQRTGELELAQEHFEKAISLDRKCSRCRNNYAVFLYAQQDYREAEKQLKLVVKDALYTARPQAFVNLGLCRLQLSDVDGADEAFVRALSMDRTNSIALLEVAQLRYDAGQIAEAGQYYDIYRNVVRQQSARGLWLGIRIERARGEKNAEASYALSLSNRFPHSPEYRAYQQSQQSEQ